MSAIEYAFTITTWINCPLYKTGDQFILSEVSLILPFNKPACLILVRDMTELLFSLSRSEPQQDHDIFSCSGCQGLIKFAKDTAGEKNARHTQHFNSGFSGRIEELPPEELMQTLNMNQKTGTMLMDLPKSTATVVFKNGQIMSAFLKNNGEGAVDYKDKEAFFMLLREKEGNFRFSSFLPPSQEHTAPIGDFMNLLMEGLQRIDEDPHKQETRQN